MSGFLIPIVIVILFIYVISLYNNVIRRRNEVEKAFGSVDTMLKKRYDLIPNLIETVKQYVSHEANVLTEVTRLRGKLIEQLSNDERIDLHNNLSNQIRGIMVSVENYPDLKANQNFLKLQSAWNEVEEQISAARRYYNAAVTDYNNSIQTFPINIMIDSSKFGTKKVFEIEVGERQNISAKELFNSK
jgi:LemA protein